MHHIGEVVLAGLLRELSARNQLGVSCLLHENCCLSTMFGQADIGSPITFSPNVPLAPVVIDSRELQFDGAHGIDVLCGGPLGRGMAIEAKLGLDRMVSRVFRARFLNPVSLTTHPRPRIKGGMVAILNYRAMHGSDLPLRTVGPSGIDIVRPWFLIIRRPVWASWTKRISQIPPFATETHIAIFEDIVQKHGDARSFDALVHRLVGDDFFQIWDLGLVK